MPCRALMASIIIGGTMQLNVTNISYTYPSSAEPVLNKVTATFQAGWTGMIGDNGSGKTTLALIVCKLLHPCSGSISPKLLSQYCEQTPSTAPSSLEEFALAYDRNAIHLRSKLDIEEDWAWRYEELSNGQQKRLQVACALWQEPDVLVLDEPTNHVDSTTKRKILECLQSFKGIGLLISHDRELLDELCEQCLVLSNGLASMHPGGFTKVALQMEIQRNSAIRNRKKAQLERKRIQAEAQRRREAAERCQSHKSLKGTGKKDSDAREKRGRYIISGQDGKRKKLAADMDKRLCITTEKLSRNHVEKRYDSNLWLDARQSRNKIILHLEESQLPLHEGCFLTIPSLWVGNSTHICLVGNNGSGKTCLIKKILTTLPSWLNFLYIPQEPSAKQKEQALKSLHNLSEKEIGQVLSVIAQLNSAPERILRGNVASPGELRKLMLALGSLSKPELLIMDEPTNYLDLGSTLALERMIESFPGALILVSHDTELVKRISEETWAISPYQGGYKLTVE